MTQQLIFQVQINGPSGSTLIELSVGMTVIGRQEGADIVLDDQMVSRRHAQIECTDEGCTITDLDSSNGTKLNGARLRAKDSVPLNPGD
ncbi:MAG: FHA domain-containing protein, partial [Chloroflexi bacterium]|nr:FHA domain-containing protein [Chloroflexota bacterium]